jgi:hypothetical protein
LRWRFALRRGECRGCYIFLCLSLCLCLYLRLRACHCGPLPSMNISGSACRQVHEAMCSVKEADGEHAYKKTNSRFHIPFSCFPFLAFFTHTSGRSIFPARLQEQKKERRKYAHTTIQPPYTKRLKSKSSTWNVLIVLEGKKVQSTRSSQAVQRKVRSFG